MTFVQKLQKTIETNNSLLCIGLDPDLKKIPKHLLKTKDPFFAFNKQIVDETHDLVCCYKPQIAYYSALGVYGLKSLQKIVTYIHDEYKLPVILDAKRADIGNTSEQYAAEAFDVISADAVTVNPYLGFDSIEPFLLRKDKGVIILCKTSNPGAKDFQDLPVEGKPLYEHVAKKVVAWNKKYGDCLLVVGSTWPKEMKIIRKIAPQMFFLVPGTGSQGGDLKKTLENGLTKEKSGLIISSSRGIIFAGNDINFATAAKNIAKHSKDTINKFRE